jgi:hypothetical protein
MKTCNHCKILKARSDFYKNKSKKDGLDGACRECSSARRLLNRYKQLQYSKEYYSKNKEVLLDQAKQRYKNNYETLSQQKKDYRAVNADVINKNRKAKYQANKEIHLARQRAWRQANKLTLYLRNKRRNTRAKHATPKWLRETELFELNCIYTYAGSLNSVGLQYHVDHIIPLQGKSVSGLHVPENLQVIQATVNIRKMNKHDQTTQLPERKRIQIDLKTNRITCETE